jgi:hypothetical protein
MTSQWDPGNYKPLDMSKIPGYPRRMPPFYKNWLPRFAGIDGESLDYHMSKFWAFFQYRPVSDEAEDLVMKLFSASLHGEARRWYDNLPAASITSMDHFEEIFLARWVMKLEDIQSLLKGLECIKQTEDEIVRVFGVRFQRLLYQIPESHRPKDKYLVYLYANGLQGHLSFLLNKKNPKTLAEAHNMAIRIEKNLSLSRTNDHTMDTLSLIKLVSLETFVEDPQERREQVFDQQNEDVIKEQEPKQDDEVSTCTPPSDKAIQEPVSPAQQNDNEVSCFPFQDTDDTLFLDSENEGEMKALNEMDIPCCTIEDKEAIHEDETITHAENAKVLEAPAREETVSCPPPLVFDDALLYDEGNEEEENEFSNVSNPACYDTDSDIVDNIDEFIHVGRRRWDIVGYDLDPIYDTESHFQVLPLQLSQQITFDQWQQGDEIFTRTFQKTKDDLVPCFPDDFQSYLEIFDEYPSEHLDSLHEDDYQPPLCSGLNTSKDLLCLKEDPCDDSPQPLPITILCCVARVVVGKYVFDFEFPLGQTLESKGWLNITSLSVSSQFFNYPLRICQSSNTSLSIPSQTSQYENVLGSQCADLLSQCSEPWTFLDPFLKWIEYFPQRWTWQDFIPPTRLHELDFEISDDMIYILTHDIFVLDLSLFWFMMKHKGRYRGTLLDWLHWSFDYIEHPANR